MTSGEGAAGASPPPGVAPRVPSGVIGARLAALSQSTRLRAVTAAIVAVIAGVHFQQYVEFMSEIPTVGVLFLLNAAGGAGLAVALVSREPLLRAAAAIGAIGLAAGSLVSIALALDGGVFGYQEPALRLPIVIAIVAELAALPLLVILVAGAGNPLALLRDARRPRAGG